MSAHFESGYDQAADWRSVDCPTCHQPTAVPCITPTRHEREHPHLERMRKALHANPDHQEGR